MQSYHGNNLIFIISQPRSGSTLLQRVLAGHDQVRATAEPWLMLHPLYALKDEGIQTEYDAALARDGLADYLGTLPEGREHYLKAIRHWAETLYGASLQENDTLRFLDKTPRYYHILPELKEVLPAAKTLLLFRNPLAVFHSIIKTWVAGDWRKLPLWYHDLRVAPERLVASAGQADPHQRVLKYETYLADPVGETRDLCEWLELPFSESLLEYGKHEAPAGRMGDPVGIHRHSRPVTDSVEKWRQTTDGVAGGLLRAYLRFLGPDTLQAMGYDFNELSDQCADLPYPVTASEQQVLRSAADSLNLSLSTILCRGHRFAEQEPLISAIVSVYKAERFLKGCLDDLEAQSIADKLEIIIVDSGSPEGEAAIVKEYQQRFDNIHYLRTAEREGVYTAWNRGIKLARGKYVTNANADDRHRPDALETLVNALEANPGAILAYGDSDVTPRENAIYADAPRAGRFHWPEYNAELLFRGNYIGPHPVWRRDVHGQYGYFDEELVVAGDYDFWLRMAATERFVHVAEPTGLYLNAPGSVEHANLERSAREVEWVRQRHWQQKGPLPPLDSNFYRPAQVADQQSTMSGKKKLPITAIIAAYNEGDVIYHVIRDLVEQDIQVVFIDHHSTDNTLEEVRKWEGRGVVRIERFPEDAGLDIPDDVYSWRYILRRKQEIAAEMGPGWYIHTDADEFRESPWMDLNLRQGIERVDREGYNAIDFKIYDFKPTRDDFQPGEDVREYLTHYDTDIHAFNNVQVKCWKQAGQSVNLWESGGHSVAFEGRKVYPVPFILRHYAIRSQRHGLQKVFQDRKTRFDAEERKAQWHAQYDQVDTEEHQFIRAESELQPYDRAQACTEVQQQAGGGEESEGYYEYARPEIQAMVSSKARRILDVGCASGKMAFELKNKLKAEVWGIEPVVKVAQQAATRLDRVLTGGVEDALDELPEAYFDCIIFADVLEHLADPEAVLEVMQTKLVPGGEIIASIPNVRHWSVLKDLLEGRWEYQDAGILDRTHLRFFTRESVIRLFTGMNLQIADMQATSVGRQEIPSTLLRGMEQAGLNLNNLAEDANHYQYLVKARKQAVAAVNRPNAPLVSIVMLTWNALDYTRQCVESIQAHTRHPHEIIFVDNGSTDGTRGYLQDLAGENPHYRIILNDDNRGFAAGNNQGVAVAKGDFVLLLNNDVLVSDGWLEVLLEALNHDEAIGMVGPITNHISGRQMLANVPYSDPAGFHAFAREVLATNRRQITPRRRIAGFAVLMAKALYEQVGGLDETFGAGNFEDDDLCLRVREAGYAIMVHEGVFIHHYGSQTFKANEMDYSASLEEKGAAFRAKWPNVDYDRLIEVKDPLSEAHPRQHTEARETAEAGDLHFALELLEAILSENPLAIEVMLDKVLVLRQMSDTDKALVTLQRILKLDPDQPIALNQAAIIAAEAGKLDEAERLLVQAIKAAPDLVDAQRNFAELLLAKDDYLGAVQALQTILEHHPDDIPTLVLMAQLNVEAQHYDAAIELAQRVVALDPAHVEARQILSMAESEV